ncbi:hypothetical protein R3P38DRAFT_2765705 [Favolaschia claudopus]|uniref:Uncharacterized protein n=1 Tax=Favolaschia claudopus TaxID=2862362 RepID=A0AAW0D712_9AGAR
MSGTSNRNRNYSRRKGKGVDRGPPPPPVVDSEGRTRAAGERAASRTQTPATSILVSAPAEIPSEGVSRGEGDAPASTTTSTGIVFTAVDSNVASPPESTVAPTLQAVTDSSLSEVESMAFPNFGSSSAPPEESMTMEQLAQRYHILADAARRATEDEAALNRGNDGTQGLGVPGHVERVSATPSLFSLTHPPPSEAHERASNESGRSDKDDIVAYGDKDGTQLVTYSLNQVHLELFAQTALAVHQVLEGLYEFLDNKRSARFPLDPGWKILRGMEESYGRSTILMACATMQLRLERAMKRIDIFINSVRRVLGLESLDTLSSVESTRSSVRVTYNQSHSGKEIAKLLLRPDYAERAAAYPVARTAVLYAAKLDDSEYRLDYYKPRSKKIAPEPPRSPPRGVENEGTVGGASVKPSLRFANIPPSLSTIGPRSVSALPGLGKLPTSWQIPGSVPAPSTTAAGKPGRYPAEATLAEASAADRFAREKAIMAKADGLPSVFGTNATNPPTQPVQAARATIPPLTGFTTHQFQNYAPAGNPPANPFATNGGGSQGRGGGSLGNGSATHGGGRDPPGGGGTPSSGGNGGGNGGYGGNGKDRNRIENQER